MPSPLFRTRCIPDVLRRTDACTALTHNPSNSSAGALVSDMGSLTRCFLRLHLEQARATLPFRAGAGSWLCSAPLAEEAGPLRWPPFMGLTGLSWVSGMAGL